MAQFDDLAEKFGHDSNELKAGEEIVSTVKVNSLDELKALFDHGDPPEARAFVGGNIGSAPTAASLPSRVEAHIFGDAPLADADAEQLKAAFPVEVTTLSALNKTLNPGEVWNLGTSTSPVSINLGTLTMEAGSSIRIQNTILKFTVQTLIRNSGSSTSTVNYDIGIFGATGATGPTGAAGSTGATGAVGTPGTCTVSNSEPGDDGGNGATGTIGSTGGVGQPGGAGLAALNAYITIQQGLTGSAGQLVVATTSGTGGAGDMGGAGGVGGPGGQGGDGATCACTGTSGITKTRSTGIEGARRTRPVGTRRDGSRPIRRRG